MEKELKDIAGKELTITRVFDAPREMVWKAWTQPEYMKRWWGPKDFTAPAVNIDLRVGGRYVYCMRGAGPDGQVRDYWGTGTYREIVPMERIVSTDSFADADGNIVPAAHYGMSGDFPLELLVTVTFEEEAGKTRMTLAHVGIPEGEMMEMTKTGWSESFDKLEESLKTTREKEPEEKTTIIAEPGKPEILATRVFDAPRELVFKVSMDPKLIPQWWGPRYLTTIVEKMDVRPGGKWRFIQRDPAGNEYAFNGEYREVTPPERVVQTFEFEGMPGHISVETAEYEEYDGKTRLNERVVFESVEDRDGMLASGGESGWIESHDRLEELLKKEKSARPRMKKVAAPRKRASRAR